MVKPVILAEGSMAFRYPAERVCGAAIKAGNHPLPVTTGPAFPSHLKANPDSNQRCSEGLKVNPCQNYKVMSPSDTVANLVNNYRQTTVCGTYSWWMLMGCTTNKHQQRGTLPGINMYIYVHIYIYIRRPLPSLGLGGAAPGITVGVRHGLVPALASKPQNLRSSFRRRAACLAMVPP